MKTVNVLKFYEKEDTELKGACLIVSVDYPIQDAFDMLGGEEDGEEATVFLVQRTTMPVEEFENLHEFDGF